MWISGGDHEMTDNIVHLVLAKTPGSTQGVKGISLFIVPEYLVDDGGRPATRNSVVLVGLNHKMGNHGTTNVLLNSGDEAITPEGRSGAVGYLVGEEFDGLRQMFYMPSSPTQTCAACCWPKNATSRAPWRSACPAPV
jgi:alkylation response protein AidB-like acyl-CoA dehydrogenase